MTDEGGLEVRMPGFTAEQAVTEGGVANRYRTIVRADGWPGAANEGSIIPSYWEDAGIYPEFITCQVAGVGTGERYYCQWFWFLWKLRIWRND